MYMSSLSQTNVLNHFVYTHISLTSSFAYFKGDTTDDRFGRAIRETYILKQNIDAKGGNLKYRYCYYVFIYTIFISCNLERKTNKKRMQFLCLVFCTCYFLFAIEAP